MENLDYDMLAEFIGQTMEQSIRRYDEDALLTLLKRGWEAWAQTEIAIAAYVNDMDIEREVAIYDGSQMRVDFVVNYQTQTEECPKIAVELKAQNNKLKGKAFVDSVMADLAKLEYYASVAEGYILAMFVFVSDPETVDLLVENNFEIAPIIDGEQVNLWLCCKNNIVESRKRL